MGQGEYIAKLISVIKEYISRLGNEVMDTKCAAALPFPGIYIKLAVLCVRL